MIKTDTELVKEAISGNYLSFVTLINKYNASLLHTIYKMVNNMADAEDIRSEVFEKVYKNLHSYSSEYNFSTWLFTIAKNHTIDFIRNKNQQPSPVRNPFSTEEEIMTPVISTDLSAEELMIQGETNAVINNIISQLKPFYRNLIEMKYFKNLTYEEIAKELNKPIGTIKTGLSRAKKNMHKILINKNITT